MRPVEEERARREWLQDDMLLYRGFMKVKERGCAVKERISKMSQGSAFLEPKPEGQQGLNLFLDSSLSLYPHQFVILAS